MNWLTGIMAIVLFGLICAEFRDMGYEQGRKDANDWWISADDEVGKMREEIWREEPKKGRWV